MDQIPGKNEYTESARIERLTYITQQSGTRPAQIETSDLTADAMRGTIENFIGATQIPVGLAGPLLFDGDRAQGLITAPFATTEGALVASACRGSRLLTAAGGVTTVVLGQTVHRAPSFNCSGLRETLRLKAFIEAQSLPLQEWVKGVSKYARLQEINPVVNGRTLHCIMHFETGDAAGQNMVTIAADHLARWIIAEAEKQAGIIVRSFQVEGGMNGDKKVNYYSFLKGRGVRVAAECFIPDLVFQDHFRLPAAVFYEHYVRGVAATVLAGGIGVNVNVANPIAALFLATGQDLASVHESSLGFLHIERDADGLYCCLTLPSLLIGTVGGGTGLPTQADALNILGCQGAGQKDRLAEIIAGFCLALDLSTWSSIAGHTFTDAHRRLGRAPGVQGP